MKARVATLLLALAILLLLVPAALASGGATSESFEVAFFHANSEFDSVRLTWETFSEEYARGFNVYRAESLYGPRIKLNDDLIEAKFQGSHMGAAYELVDNATGPRILYHYWLEAVDDDLNTVEYGPARAYVVLSIRRTGMLTRALGGEVLRFISVHP
jgi:hypothetical protein